MAHFPSGKKIIIFRVLDWEQVKRNDLHMEPKSSHFSTAATFWSSDLLQGVITLHFWFDRCLKKISIETSQQYLSVFIFSSLLTFPVRLSVSSSSLQESNSHHFLIRTADSPQNRVWTLLEDELLNYTQQQLSNSSHVVKFSVKDCLALISIKHVQVVETVYEISVQGVSELKTANRHISCNVINIMSSGSIRHHTDFVLWREVSLMSDSSDSDV